VGFGAVLWERTDLPHAGALSEQDAWLMTALDYVRDLMNRLEADLAKEASEKRKAPKGGD
jgi:hypothetical protein